MISGRKEPLANRRFRSKRTFDHAIGSVWFSEPVVRGDRRLDRRGAITALTAFGGLVVFSEALGQRDGRIWRIGFLAARSQSTSSKPDVHYDAFVEGMRALGYVQGKNLVIEWRFADGQYARLPVLAAELVKLNVQVIATHGTECAVALKHATSTIPIVFAPLTDPVGSGIVSNLARPGGNITGFSNIFGDLARKQIELLTTLIPTLSRVAVLANPDNPSTRGAVESIETATDKSGMSVIRTEARTPAEIKQAFTSVSRNGAQAVVVVADSLFLAQRAQIAELAITSRLALMSSFPEEASAGSLISYGSDLVDGYRRLSTYVDKILQGAKPGDLPIQQPTTIRLAVNLKTAKALGITVPKELLLRADDIIQ